MVIYALPENAIRSLGSGQVLTDSVALIKELIENSLDAGATQITIEISPNLLDNIQVKDNGFGIASADRDSVCLRHCTSKLHNFEDIQRVRTLGFRGEALASAAELSERMVFTTRVEGEPVAQVCEVGRDGKVREKRTIGAPVGTIVRVEGFLKKLPVRRENAIRQEKKLLAKLKVLIAKYYISRPGCRFGLKIVAKGRIGGKGDDVVHAPSKSIPEAVKRVVGKQAAGACEWVAKTEGGITFEAFLLKKDEDPAVISGRPDCTHYVYVDSRPVSCARGILKSLRSLYKGYLNSTAGEKAGKLSDPLLYLNIRCPTGTYDPNVEPAKDDVMFDKSSGEAIVNIAEELFKGLYGELNETARNGMVPKEKQQKEKHANRGFEVLLARKKDVVESPPTVHPEAPDILMEAVLAEAEEEGIVRPLNEAEIDAEQEQVRRDATLSNPWIAAKMNSSVRPARVSSNVNSSAIHPTSSPPTTGRRPMCSSPVAHSSPEHPHYPSFTPVNTTPQLPLHPHPCSDGGRSSPTPSPRTAPRTPKPRREFEIPPWSPPNSEPPRRQQQQIMLEAPDNAGAMDRFVTRIPRSPQQNQRPIPEELARANEEQRVPPQPGHQQRTPQRRKRAMPHAVNSTITGMFDLESPPPHHRASLGRPRGEFSTSFPQRGRDSPDSDSTPNRTAGQTVDSSAPEQRERQSRPRGDLPTGAPRYALNPPDEDLRPSYPRGFVTAKTVLEEVESTQNDHLTDRPKKRRRPAEAPEPRASQNSPHRNRFLSAKAALHRSPQVEEGVQDELSPRGVPKLLRPSLLNPKTKQTVVDTEPQSTRDAEPQVTEDVAPKAQPQRKRKRVHARIQLIPAPEEERTLPLVLRLPRMDIGWVGCMYTPEQRRFCLEAVNGAEKLMELGSVVKQWVEGVTGISEDAVKKWELVEKEEGEVRVLTAV